MFIILQVLQEHLSNFDSAIELAEAYLLYWSNGEFACREDQIEFFRTKGISHCLRGYNEDLGPSLSRPPTPADEMSSTACENSADTSKSLIEDISTSLKNKSTSEKDDKSSNLSSVSATNSFTNDKQNPGTTRKISRKRKRNVLDAFNHKCNRLVEFILNEGADQHLLDIFFLKIPSLRLECVICVIVFCVNDHPKVSCWFVNLRYFLTVYILCQHNSVLFGFSSSGFVGICY